MLSKLKVRSKDQREEQDSNSAIATAEQNDLNGVGQAPEPEFEFDNEIDDEFSNNGHNVQLQSDIELVKQILADTPLSILQDKYRKKVGKLLDVERPVGLGRNYLDLACRLFPDERFDELRNLLRRISRPTCFLLQKYEREKKSNASLYSLVEALYAMGRLDAVKIVLYAFDTVKGGEMKDGEYKISRLLTKLKRKLFQEDDTVSICSVTSIMSSSSFGSLSSYPSSESISSLVVYNGIQVPLKERPPSFRENIQTNADKTKNKKKGSDVVFVISAKDTVKFCVNLVHWLRKKGFEAKSIETNRVEFDRKPSEYIFNTLQEARNVIVICSAKYMKIVKNEIAEDEEDDYYTAIKTVHTFMCQEIYNSGGYNPKYIPVLQPGTPPSCIPLPLTPTMSCIFVEKDKDKRTDFLRRLYRQEKYELPPVGPKPMIKPRFITGDLSDLRK